MKRCYLAAIVAGCLLLGGLSAGPAQADFGISQFSAQFTDSGGAPYTLAGGHPDFSVKLNFNEKEGVNHEPLVDGQVRDIEVNTPAGFYGNPQAVPTCSLEEIVLGEGFCKPAAQVGTFELETSPGSHFFVEFPVYNMKTPDAQTAVLGVVALGIPAKIVISVRSAGDYGLTAKLSNLNQGLPLGQTKLTIWGEPAAEIHDPQRYTGLFAGEAKAGIPARPFLTLPARCGSVATTIKADSWQDPGNWVTAPPSVAEPLTGCDGLDFDGQLSALPTESAAGVPSGLEVDLHIPQNEALLGQATPQMRRASVTFPEGMALSPGSASGLGACADQELGLGNDAEPTCPNSSKLGVVEIDTPVLSQPFPGEIVLRSPRPGELFRLAIIARGPGLLLKIPGIAEPDPQTGQITATFDETPQLPFEDLHLELKGGPRAALSLPNVCATYTAHAELGNWANSEVVSSDSSFTVDSDCSKAGEFDPALEAGTLNPVAGSYSPFDLRVIGREGQQNLLRIEATLPAGVLAKLAGVPLCGEAQAARGDCPPASQVGTTTVGAGPGSSPIYVPQPGRQPTAVFLAGPYRGAPYSLVVKVPAEAGPFDLGTVTVRNALYVDPTTTQVTAKSDPLPQILAGVPIAYRDVRVEIHRPEFTLNPTSCKAMEVTSSLTSGTGTVAHPASRFEAAGCGELGFKPSLALSLKGPTKRSGNPALKAALTYPKKGAYANIARTVVALPHSEFLAQNHIRTVCTRVQFDAGAGNGAGCPKGSVYGTATAITPLLDRPLSGPVYLRSSSNPLPDLVAALHGQIDVDLVGRIDSSNGGIRPTFAAIPDAPVSKFMLSMKGGKKGLLVNSRDLCESTQRASVQMDGQNGRSVDSTPVLANGCAKKAHRKGKRSGR